MIWLYNVENICKNLKFGVNPFIWNTVMEKPIYIWELRIKLASGIERENKSVFQSTYALYPWASQCILDLIYS